jgi:hypothetical protein
VLAPLQAMSGKSASEKMVGARRFRRAVFIIKGFLQMPQAVQALPTRDARLYGKTHAERRADAELSAIIRPPCYCRRALLCDTQDSNS